MSTTAFTPRERLVSEAPAVATDEFAAALEQGEILVFPPGALPLPDEDDLAFLRVDLGNRITLKNISYHAHGDYLSGVKANADIKERTRRILREHNAEVTRFLTDYVPQYVATWGVGKVNFRPLQEKGRALSRHSSNELVHVDAFASGATHGDRTLRFFTNIHPTESRVWKSAGLFPALFEEFGAAAGLVPMGSRGFEEGTLDQLLTKTLRMLARAGLPQALTVDSSPYDRAMKRMHDTLKDDDAFQRDESRCSFFEFPPFTSWMCFTDMVSHACVSGQHAIVNTWTVSKRSLVRPELAPFELMRR